MPDLSNNHILQTDEMAVSTCEIYDVARQTSGTAASYSRVPSQATLFKNRRTNSV